MKRSRRSYSKLQTYARQQAAVAKLGQRAIAGKPIQSLMESAVKLVAETLAVEYCKVLELLPGGDALLLRAGIGWREGLVGHTTVDGRVHSQAEYTLHSQGPVIVEDFRLEKRFEAPPLLVQHKIRSGISVVIEGKDRPFGVLGAHTAKRRYFSEDDCTFLQSIANVIAMAIERGQAEAKLQRDRSYFRSIIENGSDIITVIDGEGRVLFQSSSVERLLGYAQSEVTDRHPFEFFHSEDVPLVLEKIGRALENPGSVQEAHFRIRHKDGTWRVFHGRGTVLTQEPNVRLVVNSRDVTDNRKLEARMRELLNSAPDAMVVTDRHGLIDTINSETERLFGYMRQELIGKPVELLLPQRFRERHGKLRASYVARPERRPMGTGLELFGLRKDDTEFPVEISLSPLVGDAKGMEIIAAIRDVTARKEVEQELVRSREAALAGYKAKSEFLQVVSHELRTPLNAIIGMSELLEDTALDDEQRGYLTVMANNGDALLRLINSILDFAKIESGQLLLESTAFDLSGVIEQVVSVFAVRAHRKGLELAVHISSDVPNNLIGDPFRLRQILSNLMDNAIKFTDQGEVVVNVSKDSPRFIPSPESSGTKGRTIENASVSEGRLETLHFSITDTGVGVSRDKLDTIFSSFTQADSSTTRRYGGSGLGLTIVRQLASLMGGAAWVESEEGTGSTFNFTATFGLSAVPFRRAASSDPDLTGLRALVVDDTATNRLILREILSGLGARVDETDSGAKALAEIELAQQSGDPFKLLLLDRHMPEMGGLQVAETLKVQSSDRGSDSIVLMLSSVDTSPSPEELYQLGIDRYLIKPLRRSEVIGAIAALLRSRSHWPATENPHARALRILLADDSLDHRLLIKAFLRNYPYTVDEAENGQIAIDKFISSRYDLLLIDRQMPIIGGADTVRSIRQWEHNHSASRTPIIALTAAAFESDIRQSIEVGCDAHISKPITKATLLSTIARVLLTVKTAK